MQDFIAESTPKKALFSISIFALLFTFNFFKITALNMISLFQGIIFTHGVHRPPYLKKAIAFRIRHRNMIAVLFLVHRPDSIRNSRRRGQGATPCAIAVPPCVAAMPPCTEPQPHTKEGRPLVRKRPLGSECGRLVDRRHYLSRTRSVARILIHQQRIVRIGEVSGGSLIDLAVLFLGLVFLEAVATLLHIGTIQ